jgi:hypothetical protein
VSAVLAATCAAGALALVSCLPPLLWLQFEKRPRDDSNNTVERNIFFIYGLFFVLNNFEVPAYLIIN